MYIFGFTGTREEPTTEQKKSFLAILKVLIECDSELHHGDCLGSDKFANDLCSELGVSTCSHPPENPSFRANCKSDRIYPAKPYLKRNKDIVDCSKTLIAMPKGPEELRSGTWSTIRYALKSGKLVVLIWPDGSIEDRKQA